MLPGTDRKKTLRRGGLVAALAFIAALSLPGSAVQTRPVRQARCDVACDELREVARDSDQTSGLLYPDFVQAWYPFTPNPKPGYPTDAGYDIRVFDAWWYWHACGPDEFPSPARFSEEYGDPMYEMRRICKPEY